ncbi:MAG: carboxylating nicotinate-nucleotide diphosphorylase [Candidatus Binatia bacterium]
MAIAEDVGDGDITTFATVAAGVDASARILAREPIVCAGTPLFGALVAAFVARVREAEEAASLQMVSAAQDGARLGFLEPLCSVRGTARALLTIERCLLNLLARLCGIATLTASFVDRVNAINPECRVLDTRKTVPGWRVLDKYAVRCGGGHNHRFGLYDAILIKDNHVVAAGGLEAAVNAALATAPAGVEMEVECDDLEQVERALALGAKRILLDNFSPRSVREAVDLVRGRARVEVSGGVSLENVCEFVLAGADDISVGRLTHSAPAADLSMELEPFA